MCACVCARERVPQMLNKRTLSLPKQSKMNDTLPVLYTFSPKRPSAVITNHSSKDCHCRCEYEAENHTHLIAINKRFRRSNSIYSFSFSDVQMWVSEETMYMCKTFANNFNWRQIMFSFFVQYCSWWLWYPLVAVLYLMVMASQLKALVC